LITTSGVLIRTRASEISELSRATQGVTLISLDAGEKLIGLSRIPETDDPEELVGTDGNGQPGDDPEDPAARGEMGGEASDQGSGGGSAGTGDDGGVAD
jgi:DNA gyrase subunit A